MAGIAGTSTHTQRKVLEALARNSLYSGLGYVGPHHHRLIVITVGDGTAGSAAAG
jgi:hypothetical protein